MKLPSSGVPVWHVLVAGLALVQAAPALALGFQEALTLAEQQSPALQARQAALSGVQAAQGAAAALPDPRLSLGVENLPVSGMDRWRLTRDFMTMQRIGLMQEVPNRAKREARSESAGARIERERAMLVLGRLQLREALTRSWLTVQFVKRRQALLAELIAENRGLQETLPARVASGSSQSGDLLMTRQEALALADRQDELVRDEAKARAVLRRLIGPRADEALQDEVPLALATPERLREQLHRHAELAVYPAMLAMARAEMREAQAESRGDWSWEVAYSRRGPQWGDMVSVQLSFELPWQRERRQQPQIAAKQREAERVEAEREDMLRQHQQALDEQIAELTALNGQAERLQSQGLRLGQERVALTLAAYQSGRGDLSAVFGARRELLEARLRAVDLDAQVADLRARLNFLIAE